MSTHQSKPLDVRDELCIWQDICHEVVDSIDFAIDSDYIAKRDDLRSYSRKPLQDSAPR